MTEEEAKGKWCPFVRIIPGSEIGEGTEISSVTPAAFNRIAAGVILSLPHTANCIASACMAWRWLKIADPDGHVSIPSITDGHCGLAGKP